LWWLAAVAVAVQRHQVELLTHQAAAVPVACFKVRCP
jgi:hypothetical protein